MARSEDRADFQCLKRDMWNGGGAPTRSKLRVRPRRRRMNLACRRTVPRKDRRAHVPSTIMISLFGDHCPLSSAGRAGVILYTPAQFEMETVHIMLAWKMASNSQSLDNSVERPDISLHCLARYCHNDFFESWTTECAVLRCRRWTTNYTFCLQIHVWSQIVPRFRQDIFRRV